MCSAQSTTMTSCRDLPLMRASRSRSPRCEERLCRRAARAVATAKLRVSCQRHGRINSPSGVAWDGVLACRPANGAAPGIASARPPRAPGTRHSATSDRAYVRIQSSTRHLAGSQACDGACRAPRGRALCGPRPSRRARPIGPMSLVGPRGQVALARCLRAAWAVGGPGLGVGNAAACAVPAPRCAWPARGR